MRQISPPLLLLVASWPLLASAGPAGDSKALEGTWRGWVVEGKGETPNQGPVQLELVIKGDRIVATQLNGKAASLGEGTYHLSVVGQHKAIDATRTSAPGKGRTHPGIYALKGDTLKWCVANPNGDRPTEFVTRRGQFLLILKRQKP